MREVSTANSPFELSTLVNMCKRWYMTEAMSPFGGKDPKIFYTVSDMKNNSKFGFYTLELTTKYIFIGSFTSICRKPPLGPFGDNITKDGGKGHYTQNPSDMIT